MPRVLIVAEHASARFGGEAALPLHYFRILRARGAAIWLVAHARTRAELEAVFPDETRIHYVEDTAWHRFLDRTGRRMPDAVAYLTVGYLSRLTTQLVQRGMVRRLIAVHAIDVVHQPMPVSPREPSMLFGFGIPVVMGPMNGGMQYPPAFKAKRGRFERFVLGGGRSASNLLNWLIPGKRVAATLMVANERTRSALPGGIRGRVVHVVENGVDLAVWRAPPDHVAPSGDPPTFVFMGRLVGWKAVDLLLQAYAVARKAAPMRLWIVGDGGERDTLERLCAQQELPTDASGRPGTVQFLGWLPQATCAETIGRADVLVLPSLLECGGAVVLEAMALGKPVIATAWGGPLDYLDPSCGVLIEPADAGTMVARWADAMVALALDFPRRSAMGRAGRERVVREFDWEVKANVLLDVYREAISRVPRKTR